MKNKNGENIHIDQLEELGVLSSAPIKQDRIHFFWLVIGFVQSDQLSKIRYKTACPLDSLAALLDQNCQYLKVLIHGPFWALWLVDFRVNAMQF